MKVVWLLAALAVASGLKAGLRRREGVRARLVEHALRNGNVLQPNLKGTNPIDHLRNIEEGEYVANVTIGTPPQEFSLIMDTGSGNVWAPGVACKDKGCSSMHKFNQAASGTFHDLHTPFVLVYGTGSCWGTLATESISTGPAGDPQAATIKNQTWGYATAVAKFFETVPDCDGIWGLGLPMTQEPPTIVPPLQNMVTQGIITNKQFAVFLDSGDGDLNSEISFGEYDKTKYTGHLYWQKYREFPPGELIYYMAAWTEMTFNGVKIAGEGCSDVVPCLGVVDTGTSVLLGPEETVNKINAQLNVAADCSNFGKLAPVVIALPGGIKFNIPSDVYIVKANGTCTSGFFGTPVYQGFWILGDPFLRSVYTIFDNDNNRFGFAQSVGPNNARK